MDRLRRIYKLHQIITSHRYPVPHRVLQEKLECSRATVNRIIQEMRDFLGAPLEYDRERNGYHYAGTGAHPYELPGLWFNASELYALLDAKSMIKAWGRYYSNARPHSAPRSLTPSKFAHQGRFRAGETVPLKS